MGRSREGRKPLLVTLFEAAAVALDLDQGPQVLALRFVDGELVAWGSGRETHPPAELADRDARIVALSPAFVKSTWLVDVASDPRSRLEAVLPAACRRAGVDVKGRETEVSIRLGVDGHVRWLQPTVVRVPASALERGFDESAAQ